jgi:hypothetical protein
MKLNNFFESCLVEAAKYFAALILSLLEAMTFTLAGNIKERERERDKLIANLNHLGIYWVGPGQFARHVESLLLSRQLTSLISIETAFT